MAAVALRLLVALLTAAIRLLVLPIHVLLGVLCHDASTRSRDGFDVCLTQPSRLRNHGGY